MMEGGQRRSKSNTEQQPGPIYRLEGKMTKHFAFISMPAHGHVNPTLPLAEELVRRGHRVSYAVGPEFAEAVAATGADVIDTGTEPHALPAGAKPFDVEAMAPMMRRRVEDLREILPMLDQRFTADPVDAVCFTVDEPAGRMLAEKLGVAEIALIPHFAGNEHVSLRDMFTEEEAAAFDPEHPVLQEFTSELEEISSEFGVSSRPAGLGQAPVSPLNLVFLPKSFQLRGETFDDRFEFIGPSVGGRGEADWKPADPAKPLLFISLGTVFNQNTEFYRTCVEAFRDGEFQVAMSVGKAVDPASLGELPANFEVRRNFPQPAVLQHADAFLTHAGMNSTMEALHYGVPTVSAPQMAEQRANARQLVSLGVGRTLADAEEITAEVLRESVRAVAGDAELRAKLAAVRQELLESGGAVAGADAVEAHVAG